MINDRKILKTLFKLWGLMFSISAYAQEGNPPPCTEVKQVKIATDSTKRRILFNYVRSCLKDGWFDKRYDKGIIHLYEYRNEQNQNCWLLTPTIDDSYKDNPPNRFADFEGDIILIYDADSKRNPLKTIGDKASLNQCLEQVIGDRVFTRPTIKTRWTSDVLPYINKNRSEGNHRSMTGGGGSVIVRFNKDGTYTINLLG